MARIRILVNNSLCCIIGLMDSGESKISFLWIIGFLLLALAIGSVFYGRYVSTRVAIIKTVPIARGTTINFNLPSSDYPKRLEICQGAIKRNCEILADEVGGFETEAFLQDDFPLGEAYLKVSELRDGNARMINQQIITVVINDGDAIVDLAPAKK